MFNQNLSDQTLRNADGALDAARTAASHTLDSIDRAVSGGMDRVRDTTHQVRDKAARATESTSNYIRHDPVKSVLIAAATGAALMALMSLLTRSNNNR